MKLLKVLLAGLILFCSIEKVECKIDSKVDRYLSSFFCAVCVACAIKALIVENWIIKDNHSNNVSNTDTRIETLLFAAVVSFSTYGFLYELLKN